MNRFGKPNGFIRMVNQFGNIFEGTMTPKGRIHGFCVTFIGYNNTIYAGWYWDGKSYGNWMSIDAEDM